MKTGTKLDTYRGGTTSIGLKLISQALRNPTPSNRQFLNQFIERIEQSSKKWERLPPGPARAKLLHKAIDRLTAKTLASKEGKEITCRKGCWHCCQVPVFITDDEGELLKELVQSGTEINQEKLKRQAAVDDDDFPDLPLETRRCVFLGDDNCCRVYENRPASCRKYFVMSPVDQCMPARGGEALVLTDSHTEAILSGAINLRPEPGFMSAMLMKKLGLQPTTEGSSS